MDIRFKSSLAIPCHPLFGNVAISPKRDIDIRPTDSRLKQILGQSFVQVEEFVNQCVINKKEGLRQILGQNVVQVHESINQSVIIDKVQLGQLLEQLFVQVWNCSRFKGNAAGMMVSTIDLLELLNASNLSAKELSMKLDYTSTKDLKRKIILPLIDFKYIEMTNPDKPTSAKQAYKLTAKGVYLFTPENNN